MNIIKKLDSIQQRMNFYYEVRKLIEKKDLEVRQSAAAVLVTQGILHSNWNKEYVGLLIQEIDWLKELWRDIQLKLAERMEEGIPVVVFR